MLKVAIPNKGTLSEPAVTMLKECGYRVRRDRKELRIMDNMNRVEFFYLRPKDIATYVGSGTLHAGITGRDLLQDVDANAHEVMQLGFGASTFRYAGPAGETHTLGDLENQRIATSFPGLVRQHLAKSQITAHVVRLDGAVENAIRLGAADYIADVVETGTSLRNARLEAFGEPVMKSEAVLIRPDNAPNDPRFDILSQRLRGVLTARQYVLLDYNIPTGKVDETVALTPGMAGPTISPLHSGDMVAVRAMIPRRETNRIMDDLLALGAEAILATEIATCRL